MNYRIPRLIYSNYGNGFFPSLPSISSISNVLSFFVQNAIFLCSHKTSQGKLKRKGMFYSQNSVGVILYTVMLQTLNYMS